MNVNGVADWVRNLSSGFGFLSFVVGTTALSGIIVLTVWLTGILWIAALIPVAPGVVAVILSFQRNESDTLRELFRSLLKARVEGKWLAFSALLMPAIGVFALLLYMVTGAAELSFGPPRVAAIIAALPLLMCNELGWRGFAPRHLPVRQGLMVKSVVIGVMWVISVSPAYLIAKPEIIDVPIYLLVLALIPMSTLMFWLKANSKSLLMPAIFGASAVVTVALLPILPGNSAQSVTLWLVAGFIWLAAVIVVGRYGTDGLDRTIRELPADELPVDWDKIMPRDHPVRKSVFGSRNGASVPSRKSFSAVGRRSRR